MNLRIRTIARLTGVREETLRQWERRYGFPVPSRGANNYRSYSRDQVEAIRRVTVLLKEGFSASEAIEQVRVQPTDTLPDLTRWSERFWSAVMTLDEAAADAVLLEAEARLPEEVYCDEFLMPLLRAIATRFDIAREHLGSSLIRLRLRGLVQRAAGGTAAGARVVLACPSGETHEGGLLALAFHLKRLGFRPLYVGPDTPVDALAAAVKAGQASAVALSFVRTQDAAQLETLLHDVTRACRVPVVVGGPALVGHEEVVKKTGALFAESAEGLGELLTSAA